MRKIKKILSTRICSRSFAVFIGLILLAAGCLFFMPIVPGPFWESKKKVAPQESAWHGQLPIGTQEWRERMKAKMLSPDSITLLPADQNMPTNRVIKQGHGPPEELSRSSREKTVHAITNFIANVKLAGFKFDPGDLTKPIRVRTLVNSSATAQAEHAVFGVMWSASGDYGPMVDHITSIGMDQNGVDRSFNSLTPGGTSLTRLQDSSLYPIKASPDDVYPAVMDFLARQIPGGNLVLNNVYHPQAPLPLPILEYEFVEPEDYKKNDPIGTVNITLRIGGTDLQPGQAELLDYEDNGIGIRGYRKPFPKPPASSLGGH